MLSFAFLLAGSGVFLWGMSRMVRELTRHAPTELTRRFPHRSA